MNRENRIVRTSMIGIGANVFLAAFKVMAGLLAHSIAVILDAVNNLSDAMSSLITIIGTKLASRRPDAKHPYGYGRTEYLSATVISVIVLYAGVTAFVESFKKILAPEVPDYSALTLVIITVGVAMKVLLGRYVKKVGEETDSDALVDSGKDALNDAVISASTLAAAVLYMLFHISLEAWLGLLISAVIIKSGVEMLKDTLSRILGERVDGDLSKALKATVCETEGVIGAYDRGLHDDGPDRLLGAIHVEVPDTDTADRLDRMTREIVHRVLEKHHVALAAVGFYARNTKNDEEAEMFENIRRIIMGYDHVVQMHGFYTDAVQKLISFDVVIDFRTHDREEIFHRIVAQVEEEYPAYTVQAVLDADISD